MIKKIFYIVLTLFILGWVVGYYALPNQLKISTIAVLQTPFTGIQRNLDSISLTKLFQNSQAYKIKNINPFITKFEITDLKFNKIFEVKFIEYNMDSTILVISFAYPKINSIFQRIRNIWQGNQLKNQQNQLKFILMNRYNSISELYGMNIIQDSVKHFIFFSTQNIFKTKPTTRTIYDLISVLKIPLLANKAQSFHRRYYIPNMMLIAMIIL